MMKYVMLLAICAGFVGPAPVLAAAAEPSAQYAFDYACKALEVDCSGIVPPQVAYVDTFTALGGRPGVYGFFWPRMSMDIVFLDLSLKADPRFATQVLVHEVTHYIDAQLNITFSNVEWTACDVEALAWSVSNLWCIEHNEAPRWNWRVSYGCYKP